MTLLCNLSSENAAAHILRYQTDIITTPFPRGNFQQIWHCNRGQGVLCPLLTSVLFNVYNDSVGNLALYISGITTRSSCQALS